ncbi:zinc-ribbon domain-containing protein [Ureibacillus chungkukjangi]|uniref:zinc-ribbon domain-containing protein n=1 Tax=Ureibacillus chungkukjangi TaxID=1202712 RepID=UPI002040E637|nr:zinc-ribbon domain-containing protein [Ureibacillus chungkukjangi]MCM3387217.1 zinc-ribbon domain-containing protein [Ureibacillus chungkukjangi]
MHEELKKNNTLKNNAMLKVRPDLWNEWDFEKNNGLDLDINSMTKGMQKYVWWICSKCNSGYDMKICNRVNGSDCPYCAGKRVNETNSLASLNPELAKEWHPSKNGGLTPYDVTSKARKTIWWFGECGHEWKNTILNRNLDKNNCPICSNKKVLKGFNDIWTTDPEVAKLLLDSDDGYKYIRGSNVKLDWICEDCKSVYDLEPYNKIVQNYSCPYCRGLRVNHTNSLATKNPDLASQWHPTKNGNLTPHDVSWSSHKRIWWLCEQGHEWDATVNCRNSKESGGRKCPVCNVSKGEEKILNYLNSRQIDYKYQKTFSNLTGVGQGLLSYDFYLPHYNLLIEYQGQFHDGSGGDYTKENLTRQQEHDKRKREYAEMHNIALLEIWYWDFDFIENILMQYI